MADTKRLERGPISRQPHPGRDWAARSAESRHDGKIAAKASDFLG